MVEQHIDLRTRISKRIPGTESHFDNLADLLPDDVLEPIGNEMTQNYMDYKTSRKEWEQSYIQLV